MNKQTDVNLENQNLLCEAQIPAFQRISHAAAMSADTRALVRENVLQSYGHPAQDEPEGITACYERLSQEDKNDGESNSIQNQKRILERYCKDHGYTPIRHYDEDDGYSGTNFNRPGFQRMLADVKAGKVARVIVKDMSRFGRDYLQVGMYTDIVFPEYGVHFVAVNDGVDSTRGENEFAAIRNVFNEMFARDTSKKIRSTWQSKGKSGEHLATTPPYGYMKSPADKKRWVIDEGAAAVVQKMYSLCMAGKGPAMIATWLQEHKILCPSAYWKSKGLSGTKPSSKNPYKWSSEVVSKILSRIEYLGYTVNFKTCKQSYKSKKKVFNDPNDWAIFENTHEPIVEESVFSIVQNIRKSRQRRTRQGTAGLFSGLLYCDDCDAKMYLCRPHRNKPSDDYYICSGYRKGECTLHRNKIVVLHEIILKNLRDAISYVTHHENDFIREAIDISTRERDREYAVKKETLEKSEKRIAELDVIVKRLYEDNVTGKLTDERFIKLSRDYELEQDNLKSLAEAMRQELKQQEQKKSSVKSFIAAAKKYTDLQALDTTILHEFIDRIFISAKDEKNKTCKIRIVYNFIGAFDFEVTKQTKTALKQQKTA
ncbi:MAG: recombinase family protein [Oscillospiraceae bacterium]|nr:recombinase family protein [Oscillospiraceae bacterium]